MLKYSISPKRDSVAQARVRAVYIFWRFRSADELGILEKKLTLEDLESCNHESITQFLIFFFFFFLAHRILLATMGG